MQDQGGGTRPTSRSTAKCSIMGLLEVKHDIGAKRMLRWTRRRAKEGRKEYILAKCQRFTIETRVWKRRPGMPNRGICTAAPHSHVAKFDSSRCICIVHSLIFIYAAFKIIIIEARNALIPAEESRVVEHHFGKRQSPGKSVLVRRCIVPQRLYFRRRGFASYVEEEEGCTRG